MENCPQCGSSDVEEDGSEQKYSRQSQDTPCVMETTYTCNNCNCEFTVTETTTKQVEITKDGDEEEE